MRAGDRGVTMADYVSWYWDWWVPPGGRKPGRDKPCFKKAEFTDRTCDKPGEREFFRVETDPSGNVVGKPERDCIRCITQKCNHPKGCDIVTLALRLPNGNNV